jgi:hypothetical protein
MSNAVLDITPFADTERPDRLVVTHYPDAGLLVTISQTYEDGHFENASTWVDPTVLVNALVEAGLVKVVAS